MRKSSKWRESVLGKVPVGGDKQPYWWVLTRASPKANGLVEAGLHKDARLGRHLPGDYERLMKAGVEGNAARTEKRLTALERRALAEHERDAQARDEARWRRSFKRKLDRIAKNDEKGT